MSPLYYIAFILLVPFILLELDNTQLYYYGARYYDPALGRFLSPDPVDPDPYNPQSLNPYSYVLNNPVRYIDPTGNRELDTGPDTNLRVDQALWDGYGCTSCSGNSGDIGVDAGPLSSTIYFASEALSAADSVLAHVDHTLAQLQAVPYPVVGFPATVGRVLTGELRALVSASSRLPSKLYYYTLETNAPGIAKIGIVPSSISGKILVIIKHLVPVV